MSKNPLDLNGLTMDDIDFSRVHEIGAKLEQTEKECKEKYGDDWWEHYVEITNPHHGIDGCEEIVNDCIYKGYEPCVSGELAFHVVDLYWTKLKRLFGPFYKRYVNHEPNNPKVNKALIKDALKSGKWRELPKELQEEYQKLAGK